MSKFKVGDKVILLPPSGEQEDHDFGTSSDMWDWVRDKTVLDIKVRACILDDGSRVFEVNAVDYGEQSPWPMSVTEKEIRLATPEERAVVIIKQLAEVPKDGWALVRIGDTYKVIAGGYSDAGIRRGFDSNGVMLAHYEADIDDIIQIINVE